MKSPDRENYKEPPSSPDFRERRDIREDFLLEAAYCLANDKPIPEKTKMLLMIFCYDKWLEQEKRRAQPRSRHRRKRAKILLVKHVHELWFHFSSLEAVIEALPSETRGVLEDEGYKVENDDAVRRLFIRADIEFFEGAVQKYHLWAKRQLKSQGIPKRKLVVPNWRK